ncbi:hypothetical protein [Dactylosporangium sp. CS-033363]|uniref:hypothetical protein n=1 Tax=Dactylosporangium sp. CS-033363 TaxID=3239935 RepID=UPI003D8DB7EE
MATARIAYDELPAAVRAGIEHVIGTVVAARPVDAGLNSAVAARLTTASGAVFCKALPADHRWIWTQAREAAIAPYLVGVAPRLLGRVEAGGWDVLLFEDLPGHHADFRPGSADLPAVVALLDSVAATPCPRVELRDAAQRLQQYLNDPAEVRYFAGTSLLHTDLNNTNIIVGPSAACFVDWGWATRGAPWLDAAYWVIWLVSAGHTPAGAESVAAATPTWSTAPDRGLRAFAAAQDRIWAEIAERPPGDAWAARLAAAARRWATYRQTVA